MLFYYRELVIILLVCSNTSFGKHIPLRGTGFKETFNVLHKMNGEPNDKLKPGLKTKKNNKGEAELYEKNSYEDLNGFIFMPDWRIKSSRTKSYSYEGLLPNQDSNFNSDADLEKPNKIKLVSIDFKITQKQETCVHTVKNEIANLFYDDFDVAKTIFPLCCKTQNKCKPKTSQCLPVAKTPKTTQCMSVAKTLPKCTKKRQELTLQPKKNPNILKRLTSGIPRTKQLTSEIPSTKHLTSGVPETEHFTSVIPTTVHHTSVSNEAVVNLVIHVKCDHPELGEHVLPKTISMYPPSIFAATKNVPHVNVTGSKYNFSVNYSHSETTEVTKYSVFKSNSSLNDQGLYKEPCAKQYENNRPNECPKDMLFGEQDTTVQDENCKDNLKKIPQPLLPHDITVPITKPSLKPRATTFPAFICRITPIFCNFTSKKQSVLSRSVKPGFTLWKKINLPHLWQSTPKTKSDDCSKTESTIEEPMCKYETEDQTAEDALDRLSCDPDLSVTEKPSVNKCKVPEHPKTVVETSERITCDPILNDADSLTLIRDEINKAISKFGPFPIECDEDSTTLVSSEPCCPDTESSGVVTEPAQCSTGREELSTEPCKPSPQNEKSVVEVNKLHTEDVSSFAAPDQPCIEPKHSDSQNRESGHRLAQNTIQPNNQETPTTPDIDASTLTQEEDNTITPPDLLNILIMCHSSTGVSEPSTKPGLLFSNGLPLQAQDVLLNAVGPSTKENSLSSRRDEDERTQIITVTQYPQAELKSTPFTDYAAIPVTLDLQAELKSTPFTDYAAIPVTLDLQTELKSTTFTDYPAIPVTLDLQTELKSTTFTDYPAIPVTLDLQAELKSTPFTENLVIPVSLDLQSELKSTLLTEYPAIPVTLDLQAELKSTPFTDYPVNHILDKASEGDVSTVSIDKLIESEQSVKDFSTSASKAAAETPSRHIAEEGNVSTNVINPKSSIRTESYSPTIIQSYDGVSDENTDKESITLSTKLGTFPFDLSSQTVGEFLISLLTEHISSTDERKYTGSNEGDIGNIIELKNNSYLFYRDHKWFISNTNHLWSFDEGTVEIVNDTFFKISIEHSVDNNDKNKEIVKHMFIESGTYNESEEVPFEIFVQAILFYSEYNHEVRNFEWSGIYLNVNEIIAILRITNFDSLTVNEWGSVDWMIIHRLIKESSKSTSQDYVEYNIVEVDGSNHSLVAFSNGSSIWKNITMDRSEMLSTIQKLNINTHFFKQTMYVPYKSNDPSLLLFVKNVFQQRTDLNVTYSGYVWESSTYNWDELLALLVMINTTLTDITNLELSMRQNWDDLLVKFRSSKRHYYTDRTIYEIGFNTEMKQLTMFTNGTTDFDGKRVSLDEVVQRVKDFTVSEVSTTDVHHVINLGGEKLQFYWNSKWYITDNTRTWKFEDETSLLMNGSFFNLPEDLTVSRDSIQKLMTESSYSNSFEMPFEMFAQSILTAAKYSESIYFQWSGYSLNYADIFAMLRLSNFNNFNVQTLDSKWGQINWYTIYDKVKLSPKSTRSELEVYEMLDYDGFTYPLIVFSNGTSIWKDLKLDLAESLTTLKNLNKDSHFPDVITVSSYNSRADSFLLFMADAIADRVHNKILHSFYNWKTYQFKWEDLEAINRLLLHQYEVKLENDLSFSKIALPVLSSSKQVFPNRTEFQVLVGSENKPLIVYSNGTTEYENVRLEFLDTVQQVEEFKKNSNMVFKEDWNSGVVTLKEVKAENPEPVENSLREGNVHEYDWKQLNNNPFFNVCYPINLGGGKVQVYMKNTWYITNGENIWPFEDSLTNLYINELVKAMNQTFPDDNRLDKTTIQNLVDNKQTLKGLEDLMMPHELIIQHYLFFMKHIEQQKALNISKDIVYKREKLHISCVQLIIALRLSAYNNFTSQEVELPWEKGKRPNWDWFFFMGKRSERIQVMDEWLDVLNTSYFDEFKDTPQLMVYSNFSSDWSGQRLDLDEALLKVQKANELNSFWPVELNGELTSKNESFEGLYKEALNKRFESNKTYSKYIWSTESVSWIDLLIAVRFPEANPEAVLDNMFWKNSIKGITRAWKSKYSDRIEYEVSGIASVKGVNVTIYMNESTVLNGKKMDIEEYRVLL